MLDGRGLLDVLRVLGKHLLRVGSLGRNAILLWLDLVRTWRRVLCRSVGSRHGERSHSHTVFVLAVVLTRKFDRERFGIPLGNLTVESLDSIRSALMVVKANKANTTAGTSRRVGQDTGADDASELGKEQLEVVAGVSLRDARDIEVSLGADLIMVRGRRGGIGATVSMAVAIVVTLVVALAHLGHIVGRGSLVVSTTVVVRVFVLVLSLVVVVVVVTAFILFTREFDSDGLSTVGWSRSIEAMDSPLSVLVGFESNESDTAAGTGLRV